MRKLSLVAALFAALTFTATKATSAPGDRFRIGYNQAWLEGAFGRDLTTAFDESAWRRVLKRAHDGGGSVVRIWILEGKPLEGVTWDQHRPTGITPALDKSVRRIG